MATFGQAAGVFTSASGSKSTGSFTPNIGDLIVVFTAHTGNTSAAAPTDNNADGLGTYSQIAAAAAVKTASTDTLRVWVRDAFVGSATATVVTHDPGASSGGGLRIATVLSMPAGRVGTTAVRQAGKQDNQVAGTPAPSYPGAALTANMVLGSVFNDSNASGVTAPASWSNVGTDQGYNTPTSGTRQFYRDSGETGTTITFGASATAFCSTIIELDTSAVGAAADPYPYVGGGYFPSEG